MGKLKTELTRPIAKSTSLGLSDTTFFARCNHLTWEPSGIFFVCNMSGHIFVVMLKLLPLQTLLNELGFV